MNKTLMALIGGCALVAGAAAPALCADIVGTVLDANGRSVPGVKVSTSTQNGQSVGSAVTDGQGGYAIDGVSSGLYYITLAPPAGSDLRGQSVASYVGSTGLTVNWGVAPGREPVATAMPGTTNSISSGLSELAFASDHNKPSGKCEKYFEHDECCKKSPKGRGDGDQLAFASDGGRDSDREKCCKKDPRCKPKKSKKRHGDDDDDDGHGHGDHD